MHRARDRGSLVGVGTLGAAAVLAAAALAYAVNLQRRRRPAYSREEWTDSLLEIGTIRNFHQVMDDVAERGIDVAIRADVWPFLLEVFDHASTYQQRQQQHQLMVRQYQQLLLQCQSYEAALKEALRPPSPLAAAPQQSQQGQSTKHEQSQLPKQQQQQQPLHLPQEVRQFAEAHRIIIIDAVRTDFQRHTADMALDEHTIAFGYSSSGAGHPTGYLADGSRVSAIAEYVSSSLTSIQQRYVAMQQYWLGSLLGGQAAVWGHQQPLWVSEATHLVLDNQSHMIAESKRQACRMVAMLSAYALHDPDTGYCQGMSDLLLPFVLLIEDDAVAFWCFVSLMQRQRVRRNFAVDESGIFQQLRQLARVLELNDKPLMYRLHQLGAADCHFAYRMVVVVMRRDLPICKVLQLWEVLWADAWRQASNRRVLASATPGSKDSTISAAALVNGSKTVQAASNQEGAHNHCNVPGTTDHSSGTLDLFVCFVAAVIISQRRAVIDHCYDADDVLRLFHNLKRIEVWTCLEKAHELQLAMRQFESD